MGQYCLGISNPARLIDGNLNAQKYREDILGPHVVPLLQTHNVIQRLDSILKRRKNVNFRIDCFLCAHIEYNRRSEGWGMT